MDRGNFDQSKDHSQISFANVRALYNNNPLRIMEVYFPHKGWIKIEKQCTNKAIYDSAMLGVTSFQLEVFDDFDEVHYSDFALKSLIRE